MCNINVKGKNYHLKYAAKAEKNSENEESLILNYILHNFDVFLEVSAHSNILSASVSKR
jgi:hypothetical protein